MSIRLAVSKPLPQLVANRARLRRMRLVCANDNAVTPPRKGTSTTNGKVIHAALRHFATHGLAAAQHASDLALAAHKRGDWAQFRWWRDICHALDRRLASTLDRQCTKRL